MKRNSKSYQNFKSKFDTNFASVILGSSAMQNDSRIKGDGDSGQARMTGNGNLMYDRNKTKIFVGTMILSAILNSILLFGFKIIRAALPPPEIENEKLIGYPQYFGYPIYYDTVVFFIFVFVPFFIFFIFKIKWKSKNS